MLRVSRAFTLIELLTVVAVLAILAALVIGAGRRATETGRIARTQAALAALGAALEGYKRQYGDYPRTADAAQLLQALVGKVDPQLRDLHPDGRVQLDVALFTYDPPADPEENANVRLIDPWGQPYHYVYKTNISPWTNPGYVLCSAGPDGRLDATLLAGGRLNPDAPDNLDNINAPN